MNSISFPVMESFYTIQGEGKHTGRSAWFIRLGGCDVGCVWCDVKESWEAGNHEIITVDEIVKNSLKSPSRFVVITGGEPAMYDLSILTRLLKENEFEIALETSGAYSINGNFDWICVSPKKFKTPLDDSLKRADELKVVIYHQSDFKWAEENAGKVGKNCVLFLQPEFSNFNKVMPLIIDYVKDNPKWKISLQIHKIINVP